MADEKIDEAIAVEVPFMRALRPFDIERKGLLGAAIMGRAIRKYVHGFLEARG